MASTLLFKNYERDKESRLASFPTSSAVTLLGAGLALCDFGHTNTKSSVCSGTKLFRTWQDQVERKGERNPSGKKIVCICRSWFVVYMVVAIAQRRGA